MRSSTKLVSSLFGLAAGTLAATALAAVVILLSGCEKKSVVAGG